MVVKTTPVMDRLRVDTRELHTAAENHPLQKAQVAGTLPKEDYVATLGQFYLIHRTLERYLRNHSTNRAIATVVRDFQFQELYLVEDLDHFGLDPQTIKPFPATKRLIARIDALANDPVGLLAMHYVLEGSNNGSKYIAIAVRHSYGLHDGRGMKYLDPYGDLQRDRWAEFKRDMSAVEFTEDQIDHMVDVARELFTALPEIFDDISATPD